MNATFRTASRNGFFLKLAGVWCSTSTSGHHRPRSRAMPGHRFQQPAVRAAGVARIAPRSSPARPSSPVVARGAWASTRHRYTPAPSPAAQPHRKLVKTRRLDHPSGRFTALAARSGESWTSACHCPSWPGTRTGGGARVHTIRSSVGRNSSAARPWRTCRPAPGRRTPCSARGPARLVQ